MLGQAIVMGLVIAVVGALKKYLHIPKELYFIPVLVLAAVFNATNAHFFNSMEITEAVKEGLILGATASGIYGLGKSALGKS